MKKALLFTVLFAFFAQFSFSQSDKYWTAHSETAGKIITDKAVARQSFPKEFKLFDLNTNPLQQQLFTIVGNGNVGRSTVITLPNVHGNLEQFEVYEASNFDPALQAQFPLIRAFSGKGISDRGATLKLSISPQGIQTMIFRTEKASEFIEPYSQDHTVYAVFNSSRQRGQLPWSCSTDDHALVTDINSQINSRPTSSDGTLKTMRLAQSVTAEYSNYFGATSNAQSALVLAAVNNTMTRCNGVYEKDLALHLNLIANTTDVFYYNAASDPYSPAATGAGGAWNGELQTTLTSVIGDANYDIGHLFGATGGGGNAGCIGCVCNSGKGSGYTSPADGIPMGDNFDIDYVVHEVGHQLGGNHTFSYSNQTGLVPVEPGSGITIMGYAGITSYDIAPHSIDIYHSSSIAQIQTNLATKTCPVTTTLTTNATPVVAPVANRTIPKSTPFVLTGSATDANSGDLLTYCWEQKDFATTFGAASVASQTKASGPNWASFSPSTNPSRTCPILATVLAGNYVTGPLPGGDAGANIEALSSVGRTLNFRLTVRDNAAYIPLNKVAQTSFTDMTVTVDASTGPFQVTSPNTAVSWFANSSQTITWDVAGTTGAPISCSDVKISLSTDGGLTFPTILAASTPNDGTEVLTMPSTLTTTARIKIESIGNIFFDISNTNFSITTPPSDFNFGAVTTTTSTACPSAATLAVTIPTTQTGGFANAITLSATAGVPAGTTVTFAPNPVAPGSSAVATLNNANTLNAGTYVITVSGAATGASTKTVNITYVINAGAGPVLTTQPTAQTVCAPATATFTVATAATPVTYQWQSATAAAPTTFTNITGATTASYTTAATSAAMNGNVYRCIVSTQCGTTTSNTAVLTVNTAAAITTQPVNTSVCTGANATFTVVGTGTGVTYQWQSATAVGGPYTNLATGGTAATLTVTNVQATTPLFYRVILTTTTCAGTVTSNVAAIAFSAVVAITTQPTAQTVCAGSPFTFTAAATGTGLTYQWQVSTPTLPAFTNIPGATNATYSGTGNIGLIGNVYQVVCTGSCNTVTSNTAAITVNTPASLGATLTTPQIVCNGVTATFNGSFLGTGATVQWQSGPSATGPWSNVIGGTVTTIAPNTSYTTPVTTPAMNGTYYQYVVTTTTCGATITSAPVLLTVNTVAVIGTQPTAQSACIPQTATFTVGATGTGLTYQWQSAPQGSTTFANITGATSATYTTPASVLSMNGNQYRVSILSTCSLTTPTVSNIAVLTVNNPVSITQQPTAQSGCALSSYTFSVTASSPGNTIVYQWQVSPTGLPGSFVNIPGATTSSYSITNAPIFLNGNYYRAYLSVPCGSGTSSDTTAAAKISLSYKPTIRLTRPAVSNTNAAVNSILSTTVSPASLTNTVTYTWKKNGVIIPNTLTSQSIVLPVDDQGSYVVSIVDPSTGCTAISDTVVTTAATSDNLLTGTVFIYPNPVSSVMTVRYNNSSSTTRATNVAVYDELGQRVFTKAFAFTGTNGRMDIDMSRMALGTYMVYVVDADGKKLASSKAIKVQ